MPSWKDYEGWLNGTIRRTAVSKGTGEIGKGLFRKIIKQQIGIDKEEYDRLN